MTEKSQGLPMNFIVLAAISVLILILVVMFVIGGWKTGLVDSQSAVNSCSSKCLVEVSLARTATGTYSHTNSGYCSLNQSVKGMSPNVKCNDLMKCEVTKANGTACKLACDAANTASC